MQNTLGERDENFNFKGSWEIIWTAEKALGQNFNKTVHYFLNYSQRRRIHCSCTWT